MSQVHEDPDLAVEIFVLEPSGEPSPATTGVRNLPEVG
jgi:hypothetical protein